MKSRVTDAAHSVVEALLDLADAVWAVPARVYLLVSLLVLAVTLFAAVGPRL